MTIPQAGPEQDEIRARVFRLVAAMAQDALEHDLVGGDRLIDDLGFDSVRLIELTMVLERAFGLRAHRPEELVDVATVDDVVALVHRSLDGES